MSKVRYGGQGLAKPQEPCVFLEASAFNVANWDTLVLPLYQEKLAAWEQEQALFRRIFQPDED